MAVDPNDIMLMARTMWGENNNATPDEYAAIAHVMRNRMLSGDPQFSGGASNQLGSNSMARTVLAPHQFQAWDNPKAKNYPMNAPLRSPAFQAAYRIAADTMSGQNDDPTHGAVYYYNPKAPGQKTPAWAQGREGQQIGAHKFYGPLQATAAKDTTGPADYAHLIKKEGPEPTQVVGDETASTKQVGPADYAHLITGKEEESPPSEKPEPEPEPDLSAGTGLIAKGFEKAPGATAAIGAPLALGTAIPLAGAGAMGMAALPYWASIPLGLGIGHGMTSTIGGIAGAPGTAKVAGGLLDLIGKFGESVTP